jgi:hypothetical protein
LATVDRFVDVLVAQVRATHPEYLSAPFTVAEIYQNLIPYRSFRDQLGVEMNADYEHLLLRVLAGEGGYLQLEPENARKRIEAELRTSNPITTLYREFAAAQVRLHPARTPAAPPAAATPVPPQAPPAAPVRTAVPSAPPVPVAPVAPVLPPAPAPAQAVSPSRPQAEPPLAQPRVAVEAPQRGVTPPATPPSPPAQPVAAPRPTMATPAAAPARPAAPAPNRDRDAMLDENIRLRKIVADQAIEIHRLRELLGRAG